MIMARKITFIALFALAFLMMPSVEAQILKRNYTEEVVFRKEFTVGVEAHTRGFGLSARFSKFKGMFKKRVIDIEIMNLKHAKEKRQQSLYSTGRNSARGFVFGKENAFYVINATFGQSRLIAEKGRKKGVEIAFFYGAGPSLGITKPYYLELIYGTTGQDLITKHETYNSENAPLFLNPNFIFGSSGFTYGLNEIRPHPGIQAKVAINFDWANYSEFVKALEVGAMANAYLSFEKQTTTGSNGEPSEKLKITRVPILVTPEGTENQNHFLFVNFYLKVMLGKRW